MKGGTWPSTLLTFESLAPLGMPEVRSTVLNSEQGRWGKIFFVHSLCWTRALSSCCLDFGSRLQGEGPRVPVWGRGFRLSVYRAGFKV